MVKGKTTSGFAFELDDDVMNNMELLDALAEATDDNPLAVSKVCKLILGDEQRKALYATLRNDKGRVPVERVNDSIKEIFAAFGEAGKK